MFKQLIEKLKSPADAGEPFDAARFGDPLALQTKWTPAKGGGASFRTHKLVKAGFDRVEFRASAGARAFYLVFLVVGLALAGGFSFARFSAGGFGFDFETIMPIAMGLVFAVAGGCMLYYGTAPIVFDTRKGYFWKGRKAPDEVFDKRAIKHFAELEEIHALQLLSEYCRGNKSSYYSYELNLVLKDGSRINVVDHGNRTRLREDAAVLAALLDKPVWDAA